MPGLANLDKPKQPTITQPKTKIIRANSNPFNPFNELELTDIEDLIYNKISNYEINITRFKEKHNILNDNDPRLKNAKNYREKLRYEKILNKIKRLIK